MGRRFAILEAQVTLLSERLGVDCPWFPVAGTSGGSTSAPTPPAAPAHGGSVPTEVLALVRAGKKAEANSVLRRTTGASMLEAKRIIDAL